MDWISAVLEWRRLTPEEQRRIRVRNLPGKVARSMAFAGEPVDRVMLEAELARLDPPVESGEQASAARQAHVAAQSATPPSSVVPLSPQRHQASHVAGKRAGS